MIGEINVNHSNGPAMLVDSGQWVGLGSMVPIHNNPRTFAAIGHTYAPEDQRQYNHNQGVFQAGPRGISLDGGNVVKATRL